MWKGTALAVPKKRDFPATRQWGATTTTREVPIDTGHSKRIDGRWQLALRSSHSV